MGLLGLPPEMRIRIYDFCFPTAGTRVSLIPYHASSPGCHLNLPLSLYLVCKTIYAELPLLSSKLRSLDFLYLIQGDDINSAVSYNLPDGDEPVVIRRFQKILEFAERVRMVGGTTSSALMVSSGRIPRPLHPGPKCALRILEIQPILWQSLLVSTIFWAYLRPLVEHPDVGPRLEIRLLRDAEGHGLIADWMILRRP